MIGMFSESSPSAPRQGTPVNAAASLRPGESWDSSATRATGDAGDVLADIPV